MYQNSITYINSQLKIMYIQYQALGFRGCQVDKGSITECSSVETVEEAELSEKKTVDEVLARADKEKEDVETASQSSEN